jgi:hypothetical protein
LKICPFKGIECIHPDWADCQFEYSGDDPKYRELWLRGEEGKMGRNCCLLPEGISRTEMMEAFGAFGEEVKRRVLESIKRKRQATNVEE